MKRTKRYTKTALSIITVLLFLPNFVFAFTPPGGSLLALKQHPRIFLTPSNLPEIRCRAGISGNGGNCSNFGSLSSQYNTLIARADYLLNKSSSSFQTGEYSLLGFAYQMTGNTNYSTAAIERMIYFVDNIPGWRMSNNAADGSIQGMLKWMMDLCFAYDWVHDQLTQGPGSQEEKIATFIADYPANDGTVQANRWSGARFYTNWSNLAMLAYGTPLIHGIAIYGDGVNDALAGSIIDQALSELENQYIPARELAAGSEGGYSEGMVYSQYVDANVLTWILEAWQTASGENKFATTNSLSNIARWYLYFIRPHDGTFARMAESRTYDYFSKDNLHRKWLSLIASKYQSGYAQYMADQLSVANGTSSFYSNWVWTDILWYDTTLSAIPLDNSDATSKLFGTVGSGGQPGLGWVVMKSGNESVNDTFATFVAGDHYGAHHHRNSNAFTIHKYSSLAIDGGYYAGWYTQGDLHKYNYYWTANSKNTMVFTDDSLNTVEQVDFNGNPLESRKFYGLTVSGSEDDTADILAFEYTSDYTYTLGDATIAYTGGTSGGGDSNINLFQREFVYLKPDYFVVFDRVDVKSSYKKRWLLHSITEPQVDGTFTSGTAPNAFGGTPGYTSIDSGLVTITNGSGKLFSKTLLPTNPSITKVGGPDSSGSYNSSGSYDFYVDGVNYYIGGTPTTGSEPGAWRIEVSPSTQQADDQFLHVIQTTNSSTPSMVPVQKIDAIAGNMVGTIIQDSTSPRIVMFAKTTTPQSSVTYNASYSPNITGKHLLVDLKPGYYEVVKDDTIILSDINSSSKGVLYFTSTGGFTFQIIWTGVYDYPPDKVRDVYIKPPEP